MGTFDHLRRCGDLTTADLNAACTSREEFASLLRKLEQISAPDTGAASILIVLARLGSRACDWIDEDLTIELLDVDDRIEVAVMIELGAGMRERLIPPVRLNAPLNEVTAALDAKPDLVGALTITRRSWKRVTFGASERNRQSSLPPRISESSLIVALPADAGAASSKRPGTNEEGGLDTGWDELDDPTKS